MSVLFLRHPQEPDLALFAGGELGPLARWRIEGHLDRCARCRQAVSEFFELRSKVMDLAELPQIDWEGMAAGIERRLGRERAQARRWSEAWAGVLRPRWAPALALLALLAAGGYISRRYGPPAEPTRAHVSLDATAGSVELRVGNDQVLTLMNAAQKPEQVNWRVSADAVSARYLDKETGNITINNVYTE